jgi:hypothetical protein
VIGYQASSPSTAACRARVSGAPSSPRRWPGSSTGIVARFVVVDALHEHAAAFHEHHGFTRIPDALRLIEKISDIVAALT